MASEEEDTQAAMELAADAVRMRRTGDFRRRHIKQSSEDKTVQTEVSAMEPCSPILKFVPLMNLTHAGSVAFAMVTGTLSQLKLIVTSCGSHGYYILFVGLLILSLMFHFCVAGTLMLLTKRAVMNSGYHEDIEKINLFRILTLLIACVTLINICIFMLA